MAKTISLKNIIALAIFLSVLLFTFGAYADTATIRDRGSTGRTIDLTPDPEPTPAPTPTPTPTLPTNTGDITNVTSGEVNTGTNSGGNVTTGDESLELEETNIGPTNSPDPVVTVPEPAPTPTPEPASTCDSRTRAGCDVGDTERTR